MPGELLLELLSEEIPARMQRRAIEDLIALIRDKLAAADIAAADITGYVTPRRLTVIADGIPLRQPDRSEERRGPRLGAPEQAIDGFLRAAGLASIDQCEVRDTGRGEFYFAVLQRPGRASAEVLPELLYAAIDELPWPKSMRFPASELRWVRPLNSVICLFDGAVLPLQLGAVPVGRTTRGHRFLSEGEVTIESKVDYLVKLPKAFVILPYDARREMIAADLDRRATAVGLKVKPDPGLLDEVAGLVEYPVVLMGAIDEASMALPPEVLATAMRTHQKYFSCLNPDGMTAPRFLFVANNLTPDDGKTIVTGNERVLKARLADARFFWDQDRKIRLEDRVAALKERVYYDKLGTMYDKAERIERLAAFLAKQIVAPAQAGAQGQTPEPVALGSRFRGNDEEELARLAQRAARLAKADLSTGMVGEFPELQGVMGRYYARHDREKEAVADAIADHYKPQGPNDTCPTEPVSIVVALADKIDTLVSFFSIAEKPTGSGDPFALRRAALGLIRLILEHQEATDYPLRLSLRTAFGHALCILKDVSGIGFEDPTEELLTFVVDRLKIHLRAYGFGHDRISAVFAAAGGRKAEDDLVRLNDRVLALATFLAKPEANNLLVAFRRASSILAIEERRDQRLYDGLPDTKLLRQLEERALASTLDKVDMDIATWVAEEDFVGAMSILARLRRPVDEFFDKVTVNTDDRALRENRLRLLSRIRNVMNQVADFSQIEG